MLSGVQLALYGGEIAHSVIGAPPLIDTFLSSPASQKPIH